MDTTSLVWRSIAVEAISEHWLGRNNFEAESVLLDFAALVNCISSSYDKSQIMEILREKVVYNSLPNSFKACSH